MTGAVILVAAIVLLVPELLSGPSRGTMRAAVSGDEPPLRSVTVELGDEPRSAAAPRSDVEEPAVPAAPLQAAAASTESASASSSRSQVARERAPVAPPPARPSSSAAPTGWSVQVGSFESRERADRFVHRLKLAGFAAFVTESTTHAHRWYRVRVGPERDRAGARAMAVRLRTAGHPGSIVSP